MGALFGFGDLGRMDRHLNGLIWRGRLWVRPAVKGTVKGSDRTLTLYGGVAILELCADAEASAMERAGNYG